MPCDGCGFRQKIISGASTKEDFCKWLFTETHKGFTVIAHNARGYDAYFLYDYLMMNGSRPDPVIFSGSKIMYMHINSLNMRLLDSLNFLPIVALLVNKPDKFRMKLCRSYSVVNKVGTLSIIINTQTKMYVCTLEFILVDVVTLLYKLELSMHWKCCSLYTLTTIEEKG